MGCFLACFGKSKDLGDQKHAHEASTPESRFAITYGTGRQDFTTNQINSDEYHSPDEESRLVKPEKQSSSNTRKKVTFDSNVRTYEHIPLDDDAPEMQPHGGETDSNEFKMIPGRDFMIEEQKHSVSVPTISTSTTSSSECYYPPNHRYHNCRESDDEDDLYEEEGNLLDDKDDGEVMKLYDDEDDDEQYDHAPSSLDLTPDSYTSIESRAGSSTTGYVGKMHLDDDSLDDQKPIGEDNTRTRYNNNSPVLNSVENLTHLRAAAARMKVLPSPQSTIQQKENSQSLEEMLLETKSGLMSNQDEKLHQEPGSDTSLSSWLVLSRRALANNRKVGSTELEAVLSETTTSSGSNPMTTIYGDQVPILGALTMEDLDQMSPPAAVILESLEVGVGSASSFKGIPNSTSKYREDRSVNWHSTPFETRLERALNMDATKSHSGNRYK